MMSCQAIISDISLNHESPNIPTFYFTPTDNTNAITEIYAERSGDVEYIEQTIDDNFPAGKYDCHGKTGLKNAGKGFAVS